MGFPASNTIISDKAVIGYIFQDLERQADQSWVPTLANRFNSTQLTETYGGIGNAPPLREFLGPKVLNNLKEYSIQITNKDWESTLKVNVRDLQRDKTGQLQMKTGDLARRAAQHDEKLLSALIDTGDDADLALAYDGQFFFDTDHVINNSGTINNDITYDVTTTTAPTSSEAAAAMMATAQALFGFKDDQGEPANQGARRFTVMVPITFWGAFQQAASKEFLSNGVSNPALGNGIQWNVVANARLTWTTAFAMFIDDMPRKPFIVQLEDGPRVEVLSDGSDYQFHNQANLYSVVKSGNVGYGDFTKACLCTLI